MLNEIIGETLSYIVVVLEIKMNDVDISNENEFLKYIYDMADVWYENRGIVKLILLQVSKDEDYGKMIKERLSSFYDRILDLFIDQK